MKQLTGYTSIVALGAVLLSACGAAVAPKELLSARDAYAAAEGGPAKSLAPVQLEEAKQSLAEADKALYAAKAGGRNRVVLCGSAEEQAAPEQPAKAEAAEDRDVSLGNAGVAPADLASAPPKIPVAAIANDDDLAEGPVAQAASE